MPRYNNSGTKRTHIHDKVLFECILQNQSVHLKSSPTFQGSSRRFLLLRMTSSKTSRWWKLNRIFHTCAARNNDIGQAFSTNVVILRVFLPRP